MSNLNRMQRVLYKEEPVYISTFSGMYQHKEITSAFFICTCTMNVIILESFKIFSLSDYSPL